MKMWFMLVSLGACLIFGFGELRRDGLEVNPEMISGRWSTMDGSIWFEFHHNGVVSGEFDQGPFVGSYRQLPDGDFEILKTRRGERQMVFLRDARLVCIGRHVEFRLRKKQDFLPGLVQRIEG